MLGTKVINLSQPKGPTGPNSALSAKVRIFGFIRYITEIEPGRLKPKRRNQTLSFALKNIHEHPA